MELLVDGQVLSSQNSHDGRDYNFTTQAPNVIDSSGDLFTLQVRATDTSNRAYLSNIITLESLAMADDFQITNIEPAITEVLALESVSVVSVSFNKPVAPQLNRRSIWLEHELGFRYYGNNLELLEEGQLVQLEFSNLPLGEYQIKVNGDRIQDLAGNKLAPGDFNLVGGGFTVQGTVAFSRHTIPLDNNLQDLIPSDINGDEIIDLVIAGRSQTSILLGVGDGTFTEDSSLDIELEAQFLRLGDFNRDDHLDLFSINTNDSAKRLLERWRWYFLIRNTSITRATRD